jgi:predicted ribosomally synthesized peptide with nif11-like leader
MMRTAETDPALAGRLARAESLERLVQLGAESGFSFTLAELRAYLEELPATELSERELGSVAGGVGSAHVAISLGDGRTIEAHYLKYELKKVMISS